jgi:hypothetical protein
MHSAEYLIQDDNSISLNSKDAESLNGTYLSQLKWGTKGILFDKPNLVYADISVLSVQIPNIFYSINEYNNVLNYEVGTTSYSLSITQGFYNANTLISYLTANMSGFTITFNTINGFLTFTNSSSDFTFLSSSTTTSVLGFNTTISSSSYTLTMSYPLNLYGSLKIKITSNLLKTNNYDSDCDVQVLAIIPKSAAPYQLIEWENRSNFRNVLSVRQIDEIDLQLYDDNNNLLNMQGLNWSINLRLGVYRYLYHCKDNLGEILEKLQNPPHDYSIIE